MISMRNVKKIYRGIDIEKIALDNVSVTINKGEFVAIMGKSGTGKSTLLNLIGCLDNISEGEYYLDDINVGTAGSLKLDKIRKNKISFIFQNYELLDNYTIYENIELPLLAKKINIKHRRKIIKDTMLRLGIYELSKKYPKQISGGEQQRTAIARALVAGNDYILADEPTGALDEETSIELMNIFKTIHKDKKTIIMVTHDKEIASFADRIIEIVDGKIL